GACRPKRAFPPRRWRGAAERGWSWTARRERAGWSTCTAPPRGYPGRTRRKMLRLAIRNLLRRPARLTLTLAGLAVSVALSTSLLAFADGYQTNLRHDLDRAGIQLMLVPLGCPYDAGARALKGRALEASLPA